MAARNEEWRRAQAERIRLWKPERYRKTVTRAGGAPRKYGQEIRGKMRELYKAGVTPGRIAKILGIPKMTVYREFGLQPQTWIRQERSEHEV